MIDEQAYKRIFEDNNDGAAILEQLIKMFHRAPVRTSATEGIGGVLSTYMTLGEHRPIDFILQQINKAHGVNEDE